MQISEQTDGKDLTLVLSGNFDEVTSPQVEAKLDRLMAMDVRGICFDLGDVQYMSSAGIRVLIIAYKKAVKAGKSISIGRMSDKAKDVLETVGILPLFKVKV